MVEIPLKLIAQFYWTGYGHKMIRLDAVTHAFVMFFLKLTSFMNRREIICSEYQP